MAQPNLAALSGIARVMYKQCNCMMDLQNSIQNVEKALEKAEKHPQNELKAAPIPDRDNPALVKKVAKITTRVSELERIFLLKIIQSAAAHRPHAAGPSREALPAPPPKLP